MTGLLVFPCPPCGTDRTVSVLDCAPGVGDVPDVALTCPVCGVGLEFRLSAVLWWRLLGARAAVLGDWHDDIATATVRDFEVSQ